MKRFPFSQHLCILTGFAIVLAGASLTGCSAVTAALSTPLGQALEAGLASAAVGDMEAQGLTAAQVNAVSTALAAADNCEPVTMATAQATLQAHLANTQVAETPQADPFMAGLGAALGTLITQSKVFAGLSSTTCSLLAAIVTASSPNLTGLSSTSAAPVAGLTILPEYTVHCSKRCQRRVAYWQHYRDTHPQVITFYHDDAPAENQVIATPAIAQPYVIEDSAPEPGPADVTT